MSAGGNVAKCAAENGCVATVHTSRLLRVPLSVYSLPLLVACAGSSLSPYLAPPKRMAVSPSPADGSLMASWS